MNICKRTATTRRLAAELAATNLTEFLGEIEPGCEIYGLTKGQFSLIDLIEYALDTTGPADVVISTWTAAGADIEFAYRLMTLGKIRSIKFIVDFSFPARQPAYCAALRASFGGDCIRVTKNHAKFVLITNEVWNLVMRTSMNLNMNKRLENFELSDSRQMADFLKAVIAQLFDQPENLEKRPIEHMNDFDTFAEPEPVKRKKQQQLNEDEKKWYGDGTFDNDLRRAGISYGN